MKNQYKYVYDNDDLENAETFYTSWSEEEAYCIAEDAARDFYDSGGFDSWHTDSRRFTILKMDGTVLGVYDVTLEYDPTFSAYPAKSSE